MESDIHAGTEKPSLCCEYIITNEIELACLIYRRKSTRIWLIWLSNKDNDERADKDELTKDYGSIIRESALLTTFSAFLFGFLLNISIESSSGFDLLDKLILLVALFSITISISLFIMPVIYHHLEYPYIDFKKFKERSHRFTLFGLIPSMITLFLGLQLAMESLVQNPSIAFLLGTIPFVLIYVFYRLRK